MGITDFGQTGVAGDARGGSEGPGCTPTVDGERLYILGAGGELACLQAQDGQVIWRRSLTEDFGGRRPMWRYNESPLVDGDKVICTPGAQDAMLVALNKLTGETIWKSQLPGGADNGPGGFGSNPGRGPGTPSRPGSGSSDAVTGTKEPGLFTGEHYGMSDFSCKIPNGKYLAKLYDELVTRDLPCMPGQQKKRLAKYGEPSVALPPRS